MNPLDIQGLAFVELASPTPSAIEALLVSLGFSRTHEHREREVDLYAQNDIRVLLTREHGTHAHGFAEEHGPSVSAIGLRVDNARLAAEIAVRLGANEAPHGLGTSLDAPAIAGIGGALVYFVDTPIERSLVEHREPIVTKHKGLVAIDHLTNTVHKGALERTAQFYKNIFGFTAIEPHPWALRSPCGTFALPIREGSEDYLREHRGAGVQHIAFFTEDLLATLDALGGAVTTREVEADYYRTLFERVPFVGESHDAIRRHNVLVDGDARGYVLRAFADNVMGPMSLEFIQRHNHLSLTSGSFFAP